MYLFVLGASKMMLYSKTKYPELYKLQSKEQLLQGIAVILY